MIFPIICSFSKGSIAGVEDSLKTPTPIFPLLVTITRVWLPWDIFNKLPSPFWLIPNIESAVVPATSNAFKTNLSKSPISNEPPAISKPLLKITFCKNLKLLLFSSVPLLSAPIWYSRTLPPMFSNEKHLFLFPQKSLLILSKVKLFILCDIIFELYSSISTPFIL